MALAELQRQQELGGRLLVRFVCLFSCAAQSMPTGGKVSVLVRELGSFQPNNTRRMYYRYPNAGTKKKKKKCPEK